MTAGLWPAVHEQAHSEIPHQDAHKMGPTYNVFVAMAGCSLALLEAVAVILQRKRSAVRWLFAIGMLLLALESAFTALAFDAATGDSLAFWHKAQLIAAALLVGPWLVFANRYARGRQALNSRAYTPWAVFLAALSLASACALLAGPSLVAPANGDSTSPGILLGPAALVIHCALLATAVTVLAKLEQTFHHAAGTSLWRIKSMLLGIGLIFAARVFSSAHALLYQSTDARVDAISATVLPLACVLLFRSLRRSGHFETHLYVSTSVLRGSVTLIVVGAYFLGIGIFSKLSWFGARDTFGPKALIIVAALVAFTCALQSDRLRQYIRRAVSRHFQRPYYDYRAVWQSFNDAIVSESDSEGAARAVVRLTADLLEAKSVSLWVFEEGEHTVSCAASTVLDDTPRTTSLSAPLASELARHFLNAPTPANFETSDAGWAQTLRALHPRLFRRANGRIVAPLVRNRTVVGFLVVGDALQSRTIGEQDIEILRCVADHAASHLLGIQLTQQSTQHRELAAFQTMGSFFVHDLKNAASTLALMLPNLSAHWDDPEFREDAMRAIRKTGEHINSLVSRLSKVRCELGVAPRVADLRTVIDGALANWTDCDEVELTTELTPVAPVLLDERQFTSVITNLVMNAREAVVAARRSTRGCVRIATRAEGDFAVVTVQDNGCGMDPDFIAHSLFKPFKTTKKNGLGIGLFQVKALVGAHGGRITVESIPAAGSTFDVYVPFAKTGSERPAMSQQLLTVSTP